MVSITGWLCLLTAVVVGQAFASPLAEVHPLAVVSELGQRLVSRSRLQEGGEARLSLPTPQELEAIKKVAQILVMLGEQVIPTIIGDIAPPPPHATNCAAAPVTPADAPSDPVNLD